jgi:hypothetical protein
MLVGDLVEAAVPDRTGADEVTFNIQGLRFDRPGRYEFRLFANGRHLGGVMLTVIESGEEAERADER